MHTGIPSLNIVQKDKLPDHLKAEVMSFVEYLEHKAQKTESAKTTKRQAGLAKGMIKMRDDFDEPLDDFKEYM